MEKDVARHLIEARARLGLTQDEFAARIGVSQGAVSRWEKGRHRPNPEVMIRLGELSGAAPPVLKLSGASPAGPLTVAGRLGAGRSRLRFRPIEEPRRRLSDLVEASIVCARRTGKHDLAGALQPILERCHETDRRHPQGLRADDATSH